MPPNLGPAQRWRSWLDKRAKKGKLEGVKFFLKNNAHRGLGMTVMDAEAAYAEAQAQAAPGG